MLHERLEVVSEIWEGSLRVEVLALLGKRDDIAVDLLLHSVLQIRVIQLLRVDLHFFEARHLLHQRLLEIGEKSEVRLAHKGVSKRHLLGVRLENSILVYLNLTQVAQILVVRDLLRRESNFWCRNLRCLIVGLRFSRG